MSLQAVYARANEAYHQSLTPGYMWTGATRAPFRFLQGELGPLDTALNLHKKIRHRFDTYVWKSYVTLVCLK